MVILGCEIIIIIATIPYKPHIMAELVQSTMRCSQCRVVGNLTKNRIAPGVQSSIHRRVERSGYQLMVVV